jgi:hypothetical protein
MCKRTDVAQDGWPSVQRGNNRREGEGLTDDEAEDSVREISSQQFTIPGNKKLHSLCLVATPQNQSFSIKS